MHIWAKPKTLNITSNLCFFLFASPNLNPKFTAYHICDPSVTSQNTMCIHTYSFCWLQNISIFKHWLTLSFVGPCPCGGRDYCIGSNFWKLYLIKIGFTLSEPVSLMKVFRLKQFFLVFWSLMLKGDWRKGVWGSKSSPCKSWEAKRQKGQEGHRRWGEFLL